MKNTTNLSNIDWDGLYFSLAHLLDLDMQMQILLLTSKFIASSTAYNLSFHMMTTITKSTFSCGGWGHGFLDCITAFLIWRVTHRYFSYKIELSSCTTWAYHFVWILNVTFHCQFHIFWSQLSEYATPMQFSQIVGSIRTNTRACFLLHHSNTPTVHI